MAASQVAAQDIPACLLETLLSDLVAVAHFYASSDKRIAVVARQALRSRDASRPYHVSLWMCLHRLRDALAQLPLYTEHLQNSDISLASTAVLNLLEEHLIQSPDSPRLASTAFSGFYSILTQWLWGPPRQDVLSYPALRAWHAQQSNHPDERISTLAQRSRLGDPELATATTLLQLVEYCTQVARSYIPKNFAPCYMEIETSISSDR